MTIMKVTESQTVCICQKVLGDQQQVIYSMEYRGNTLNKDAIDRDIDEGTACSAPNFSVNKV